MKKAFSILAAIIFSIGFSAFTFDNLPTKTPLPDLIISSVEVKCSNQRWLVFYVKNIGDAKSDATLLRIRPIDNHKPTDRCITQAVINVPILQPGKDFRLRIPLKEKGTGCDCTQDLKFELVIDHKNYIAESDETNNTVTHTIE